MVDPTALTVLRKRYLLKNADGEVTETPDGMFERVARAVSEAEDRYDQGLHEEMAERFYRMMSSLEFLPNSPTLMNAGRDLGQLAACFVLPVDDALDSIFNTVKETARIHQTGGGTGFSFSRLRPKDDIVSSTMGVASGPVSFIKVFNMATEVIKQGGTRRGANMGVLRVDHPDIEEFVLIKRRPEECTNFNLSVALTDRFMEAHEKNAPFPLVNPRNGKEVKTVNPRDLLTLIAESAWFSGEPGVLFIDTINRANPTPARRRFRGDQPVRGTAASALRVLLPRFHQPIPSRTRSPDLLETTEGSRPPGGEISRRCDRCLQVSSPPDRGDYPWEPKNRSRGHGICPYAHQAGYRI